MRVYLKRSITAVFFFCALGLSACGTQERDDIGLGGSGATYAARYAPARTALRNGDFASLQTIMGLNPTNKEGVILTDEELKHQLVAQNSELSMMERGLLTLNSGDYKRALLYFDAAELKMEATDAVSKRDRKTNKAKQGTFATLSGIEESKDYPVRGYEKVMIYNYKALCYMLLGERKAYNVTRKAIDKQQEEWELFQELLSDLEKENENRRSTVENKEKSDETNKAVSQEDGRTEYTKKQAELLPNAYVNPFGDYMNAMILEIDSYEERSVRDNARIAYNKVLDNNENCLAAQQAIKDMKKAPPRNKKLVHVLLADGFSPERVEKTMQFFIGGALATANYAEASPHKSDLAGAKVKYGKSSYPMSSLSEMEAIILRDDLDRKPFRTFMIALALLRTGGTELILNETGLGSLGRLVSTVLANVQRPDTRTWLSLPNKIMVARFYVPNDAKTITIETYDAGKMKMGETEIALAEKGPSVIYAVNYGKNLQAIANESTWIAGQ